MDKLYPPKLQGRPGKGKHGKKTSVEEEIPSSGVVLFNGH